MKGILALCAVTLSATLGCASNPADPTAATAMAGTVPTEQVAAKVSADGSTVISDDGETKLICHSIASTGTRLKQRVCKTPAQIEEERERAKEATDAFQSDGGIQKKNGG